MMLKIMIRMVKMKVRVMIIGRLFVKSVVIRS